MKTPLLSGLFVLSCAVRIFVADAPLRIERDVAYLAAGRTEKLDIFFPAPASAGKLSPAVVWIHGGGWTGGTKTEARATEICTTLAAAGYLALNIDYQLGDGAWPTALLDCKNAVRFLRTHAAEYHVDPARIAVAGGSAGGHLALMVGFTAGKKEWEPESPYPGVSSAVRCVIDMYGITNVPTWWADTPKAEAATKDRLAGGTIKVFGVKTETDESLRAVSPIALVTKNVPPVLILQGTDDATVGIAQSQALARVLKEQGVEHELVEVAGAGHGFDWEKSGQKPLSRDLRPVALAFLAKHLGPAAAGR